MGGSYSVAANAIVTETGESYSITADATMTPTSTTGRGRRRATERTVHYSSSSEEEALSPPPPRGRMSITLHQEPASSNLPGTLGTRQDRSRSPGRASRCRPSPRPGTKWGSEPSPGHKDCQNSIKDSTKFYLSFTAFR